MFLNNGLLWDDRVVLNGRPTVICPKYVHLCSKLPFLLMRKMLVGKKAALMGSPHHLLISSSGGSSPGISIAKVREVKYVKAWHTVRYTLTPFS